MATALPKIVALDSGMACLGLRPTTKMYMGTSRPPPPTPTPEPMAVERKATTVAITSVSVKGENRSFSMQ